MGANLLWGARLHPKKCWYCDFLGCKLVPLFLSVFNEHNVRQLVINGSISYSCVDRSCPSHGLQSWRTSFVSEACSRMWLHVDKKGISHDPCRFKIRIMKMRWRIYSESWPAQWCCAMPSPWQPKHINRLEWWPPGAQYMSELYSCSCHILVKFYSFFIQFSFQYHSNCEFMYSWESSWLCSCHFIIRLNANTRITPTRTLPDQDDSSIELLPTKTIPHY